MSGLEWFFTKAIVCYVSLLFCLLLLLILSSLVVVVVVVILLILLLLLLLLLFAVLLHKPLHAHTRPPIDHYYFVLAAAIPREPLSVRGEAVTPLPIWWAGGLPGRLWDRTKHIMLGK